MFKELELEINCPKHTKAAKLQMISDLMNGYYDEDGEFIPPFVTLSDKEIIELLEIDSQFKNMEHR